MQKKSFFNENRRNTQLSIRSQSRETFDSFKNFHYRKSYHSNVNSNNIELNSNLNIHLVGLLGIATAGAIVYSYGNLTGPTLDTPTDDEDDDLVPPNSPEPTLWNRISSKWWNFWDVAVYIFNILSGHKEESRRILPDPLPEPYGRPYTLFVTLDLLVEASHQSGSGWQALKRPGCDYFLQYLSRFYEVVVISPFTRSGTELILDKLDPTRAIITYRLNRDLLIITRGRGWLVPLMWMNRPLDKAILLDDSKDHCEPPDNVLVVPVWDGKTQDTTLLDLIPFLQELVIQNVKDVRPVLKAYDGKEIIESYRKAREAASQKQESQKTKKGPSLWEKLK